MLATFIEYHRSFLTFSAQISYKTNTVGRSVFFSHENLSYPPALPDYGNLRSTSKSDLLKELENKVSENPADNIESAVIDGGALALLSTF